MAELNSLILLKIANGKSDEYELTLNLNGKRKISIARVEMTEPVFGVNFSQDLLHILRDFQTDSLLLIEIIKNHHHGKKIKLPVSLLVEQTIAGLQAA